MDAIQAELAMLRQARDDTLDEIVRLHSDEVNTLRVLLLEEILRCSLLTDEERAAWIVDTEYLDWDERVRRARSV